MVVSLSLAEFADSLKYTVVCNVNYVPSVCHWRLCY